MIGLCFQFNRAANNRIKRTGRAPAAYAGRSASGCKMKNIVMSESAYIIVGDLANVHLAQDALRKITQPNSAAYISQEDYRTVMGILAKWSDGMFEIISITEAEQPHGADAANAAPVADEN